MPRRSSVHLSLPLAALVAFGIATNAGAENRRDIEADLIELLEGHAPNGRVEDFLLPEAGDLASVPADPLNPLTPAKVELGRLLFHETAVGTATPAADRRETYACASCHHAAAGFKAGVPQGIADGGSGFDRDGRSRRLARGLDAAAADGDPAKPDLQPVATPAALNAAYQDVMLWNGALGGRAGGVNEDVARRPDFGPPGLFVNRFGLSGLETQVLAGTRVHRLSFDDSILQRDPAYRALYAEAFGEGPDASLIPAGSEVTREALGAALAIAAYERTLLADRAPFQRWLRGERRAMTKRQLRGARLFFGKAGCADCHTGPALSSWPGAPEEELFFAAGFADLDTGHRRVHGTVPDADSRGRGGFTDRAEDDYRFKVPQLYNLRDTRVLGHGASFRSVGDVIRYKNAGIAAPGDAQNGHGTNVDASLVAPLGLDEEEIVDLTRFVKRALHDPALERYVPSELPSGNCFPVADFESALDLRCY